MEIKIPHLLFLTILTLAAGCGKRPRTLDSSDTTYQKKPTPAPLPRFAFPIVRGLQGTLLENGTVRLTWSPVVDARLAGYHMYKFEKGRSLRHKTFSTAPVLETTVVDELPFKKYKSPCYAVRGIFMVKDEPCLGPLSNVVLVAPD